VQAFGSDWGVFSFQPLPAIYCVVTRMTPEGTPAGGWYPAGRISVEVALRHFTRDGAYASFDEDVARHVDTRKVGGLRCVVKDNSDHAASRNPETKVLLTVMGGKDTYRDKDFR